MIESYQCNQRLFWLRPVTMSSEFRDTHFPVEMEQIEAREDIVGQVREIVKESWKGDSRKLSQIQTISVHLALKN